MACMIREECPTVAVKNGGVSSDHKAEASGCPSNAKGLEDSWRTMAFKPQQKPEVGSNIGRKSANMATE